MLTYADGGRQGGRDRDTAGRKAGRQGGRDLETAKQRNVVA
jgi:hypothetical protein